MSEAGRLALVTGASTGIGAALALGLAEAGFRLALGARRPDRLAEIAERARERGAVVHADRLDVADAASVERFFEGSERALGVADVVINNAGASRPAALHEYEVDWLETEVATNFLGPILVSRRALLSLRREGRSGDLVFIGSDATRRPRPQQVIYGAAKAGIENLADGLAMELEGTGIRVTKVRLGPTVSEFGAEWDLDQIGERVAYWRDYGLRDARLLGHLLPAETVAAAVIDAVNRPAGVWIDTIEIQPAAPRKDEADE